MNPSIARDALLAWNDPYMDKQSKKVSKAKPLYIFGQYRRQETELHCKMMCNPSKGQTSKGSFHYFLPPKTKLSIKDGP